MAFNVINLKHREAKEVWLHICHEPTQKFDEDGKPVFDLVEKEMKAYQYANLSAGKGDYKFNLNYEDSEIDEIIHQGLTDTIVGSYEERIPVMVCEPMYADNKKKKPVRIKFKSPHSKAFRDAHLLLSAKISQLTNGKKKEYEELAKQNAELDAEKIQNDVLESFIRSEDLSVDFVVEMAIDWEGFYDENGKELEFAPEYLQWLLCQMENYNVLHQIRNSFKDTEAFILA